MINLLLFTHSKIKIIFYFLSIKLSPFHSFRDKNMYLALIKHDDVPNVIKKARRKKWEKRKKKRKLRSDNNLRYRLQLDNC